MRQDRSLHKHVCFPYYPDLERLPSVLVKAKIVLVLKGDFSLNRIYPIRLIRAFPL